MRPHRDTLPRSEPRCRRLLGALAAAALALVGCEGEAASPRLGAPPARVAAAAPAPARTEGRSPATVGDGAGGSRSAGREASEQAPPPERDGVAAGPAPRHDAEPSADGGTEANGDDAATADAGERDRDRAPGALAGSGDLPPPGEDPAAAELLSAMARTIRDLEYNASAGLPEPPQQNVLPAPPAWTSPPGADENAKPSIQDVWPSEGAAAGGDRVVIRGKNLQPSQVLFGLAPARIVATSPEAVTVTSPPASAGPAPIVITNADGNYAMSAVPFRYYR